MPQLRAGKATTKGAVIMFKLNNEQKGLALEIIAFLRRVGAEKQIEYIAKAKGLDPLESKALIGAILCNLVWQGNIILREKE